MNIITKIINLNQGDTMKTKLYLTITTLFLTCMNLFADTPWSGTISADTTWTKAGSPHVIIADVTIDSGVTVTVEPGADVIMSLNKNIIVMQNLVRRR